MEHNGLHDRPDLYDLVAAACPVPRERLYVETACGIPGRAPCFEISPYFHGDEGQARARLKL